MQALTDFYTLYASDFNTLYASDFNDITSGSSGHGVNSNSAVRGYDLVTGLGSPKANGLIANLVSAMSAGSPTPQVSVPVAPSPPRRPSQRLDVTNSPANGTENSSSLSGSGQFASALVVQALGTQVGITQAQPVVNQAVIATQITQATAPAPLLGQSLPPQDQGLSLRMEMADSEEPVRPIEDAAPMQSPAPAEEQQAPAGDPAPTTEPPSAPLPVEPDQPIDDLTFERFDLTPVQLRVGQPPERLDPPAVAKADRSESLEISPRGVHRRLPVLRSSRRGAIGSCSAGLIGSEDAGCQAVSCKPRAGRVRSRMSRADAIELAGSARKMGSDRGR